MTTEVTVKCGDCELERAGLDVKAPNAVPCPRCGATSVSVKVSVPAAQAFGQAPLAGVSISNSADAAKRLQLLRDAVSTFLGLDGASALDAQLHALTTALERAHELNDARHKRQEWSYAHWAPADRELWNAHMGARNAAHHELWSPIAYYSDARGRATRWQPDMPRVNNPAQNTAYAARLENQPVAPSLREIVVLLESSIP